MLRVSWRTKRPDLHGLAVQLLGELSQLELSQLEEMIATGWRAIAKDFAGERGFPRSVISCIFVVDQAAAVDVVAGQAAAGDVVAGQADAGDVVAGLLTVDERWHFE